MGRVTRRSVTSKDESTPKESPKSAGKRGAKKEEPAVDKAAGGDSQDTPTRRSGRQAAKEEPKADVPARGKSAARGRSTSRGGKGKKEEEPESRESEDEEEEVEEEKVQKGSSRSRSKGKGGQEMKATNAVKSGRGAKAAEAKDKSEKNEDNVEEKDETITEIEQDDTAVKGRGGRARGKTAAVVTPSPRTERKGRGKTTAADQDSDDKVEDSVKSKKDEGEASKAVHNEADATPKGRQRRGANKEAESSETPTLSGRRGRGQKAESAPKTTPASGRSSRRGAAVEASADETPEKTEQMDIGEEEKATPSEAAAAEKEKSTEKVAAEKEQSTEKVTAEKEKSTEKVAAEKEKSTEKAAAEKEKSTEKVAAEKEQSAVKAAARKEQSAEKATAEKEQSAEKAAADKQEESTTEEAAMETQESSVTEKAAEEKKEKTATDKAAKEEGASTSNAAVEETSDPISPKKKRKLEDDKESEPSELESPNKKRRLESSEDSPVAKRPKTDTSEPAEADEVSIEEDFVVVNKDDVPAPDSKEVAASLPPKVKETSSEPSASGGVTTEDITDSPAAETATTASPTDAEITDQKDSDKTSAAAMETSSQLPSDITDVPSHGLDASSSSSADQTSGTPEPVKSLPSSDTSAASHDGVSAQDNVISAAAAEPSSKQTNSTSDAAPVVLQDTLAASQSQTIPASDVKTDANRTDEPEAMEVDAEASLENTANDTSDRSAIHQNGTDEEPLLVNSDTHLTSSPGKGQTAVRKDCVPSATASRKFILNSTFPVELMDPAYCFSVVSYNILADCHLCRGDYSYTQPQYLLQEYRHGLLLKELDELDGDIVCLQEVSPAYYNDTLLPAMKSKGYEGHLIKRTKEYWDEGEATFVKSSKFDIVSYESASLTDLAFKEIDSSGLSEAVSSAAKKYLDRADVILLTELRCKKTGKTLTICNIHVVHDPKAPDVQCIQVACAVKQLVAKAGSDLNAHIICGDFNADASKAAYQLARDGYLSDDHIRRLQTLEALDNTDESSRALIHHVWGAFQHTSSTLKSAYELTLGKEPPVTLYTKEGRSADHIFFSSASIDNVGVLETLGLEVLQASGGLPNKNIPSDHLSIKAGFRLK